MQILCIVDVFLFLLFLIFFLYFSLDIYIKLFYNLFLLRDKRTSDFTILTILMNDPNLIINIILPFFTFQVQRSLTLYGQILI